MPLSCPNCLEGLEIGESFFKDTITDYTDYTLKLNCYCFECNTHSTMTFTIDSIYKNCSDCEKIIDYDRLRHMEITKSLRHLRVYSYCYYCEDNYYMMFRLK